MDDYHLYLVKAESVDDAYIFDEALSGIDGEQFRQAMNAEYMFLVKNNTWSLVDLPPGVKLIKSKWVFKRKEWSQKSGIDYQETYSPVVRYSSI